MLAGVEYSKAADRGFFFSGELGYVLRHTRAQYEHEADVSATDHGVGMALGGGYRINNLQARAQYFILGLPDPVKQKALMFGLQWTVPI